MPMQKPCDTAASHGLLLAPSAFAGRRRLDHLVGNPPHRNGTSRGQGRRQTQRRWQADSEVRELLLQARVLQDPPLAGQPRHGAATRGEFTCYLYLPRLRDRHVLHESISEGVANMNWRAETFAVAESIDPVSGKYLAVHSGSLLPEVRPSSLVVRPEVAEKLLDVVEGKPGPDRNAKDGQDAEEHKIFPDRSWDGLPAERLATSFHGSVDIRADRLIRVASQIAEEIVTHLLSLPGADVRITLEIDATTPNGIPPKTLRGIDENCTAFHFTHRDFEE